MGAKELLSSWLMTRMVFFHTSSSWRAISRVIGRTRWRVCCSVLISKKRLETWKVSTSSPVSTEIRPSTVPSTAFCSTSGQPSKTSRSRWPLRRFPPRKRSRAALLSRATKPASSLSRIAMGAVSTTVARIISFW